jgi:hypothetical protein
MQDRPSKRIIDNASISGKRWPPSTQGLPEAMPSDYGAATPVWASDRRRLATLELDVMALVGVY